MSTQSWRIQALLSRYLLPQWRGVLALALVLFSSIALQLLQPQILGWFIDTARSVAPVEHLRNLALVYLGAVALGQILGVAVTYVAENVGWNATNRLREELALHCLRLPLSFHTRHTPGELVERVDGDVAALTNFFSRFVIQILGNMLLLAGVLALATREDWRIGTLLGVFAVFALHLLRRIRHVAVPAFKAQREGFAALTGFWEERLTGAEDLRANGAVGYTMHRHYAVLDTQVRTARRSHVMARVLQSTAEMLLALGTGLAFALGAYVLRDGAITLGTLYLVFAYTNLLAWNLLQITIQLEDLQRAVAAIERIHELYNIPGMVEPASLDHLPAGLPSIAYDHVSFSYSAGVPVLRDVSFSLEPGKILGVLGRTGSGKTTLARLLFRFYDPDTGTIRVNDRDIKDVSLAELRRRIGAVTQEVQIFHASVRDNITLFDDTPSDESLVRVIEELGLQDWYARLPDGLDTVLRSGDGALSAGEAQLLAFARAFVQSPDLIILDEASSRLDPATEARLTHAMERLLCPEGTRRTAIVIAHRLQTVQRADEIMILEGGQVVEHGPRAALQSDPASRFAQLQQTGLQEVLA